MNQQHRNSRDRDKNRDSRDRRPRRRRRHQTNKASRDEQPKQLPKRFGVVFYETHAQAKEDTAELLLKAKEVDQLNIVIRAEGSMDDPELIQYGKVYAGEAWTLIHHRRVEEGWYNEPH
ncbi:MAG: hypothetical protein ACOH5I_21715 [Oligoflexus sp.]